MKKLLFFSFFIFHFSFSFSQYMIYGTTEGGGIYYKSNGNPNYYGTIFSYNPMTHKQAVVFSFNDTDGYSPRTTLLYASDSLLYGTTYFGGAHNMGTVFSFNPITHKETVVINFDSANGYLDGGVSILMQAKDGLLYGTSSGGGKYGKGVLFSYNIHTHKDSIRYNFNDSTSAGLNAGPVMELWQDTTSGILYGVTLGGGLPNGAGVIYGFNPTNNHLTRYVVATSNGSNPYGFMGGLTLANNNLLYGMTELGGVPDSGTIYSFDRTHGVMQKVYDFGGIHGAYPNACELLEGTNKLLYGLVPQGGDINTRGCGVLFSFNATNNTEKVLKTFQDTDGCLPAFRLIQDPDNGFLYGIAQEGGDFINPVGYGVIFSYDIATSTYSKLFEFTGYTGVDPNGLTLVKDTSVHVPKDTNSLGVSQKKGESEKVEVYPNPGNGAFTFIIASEAKQSNPIIEVYNVIGEKVYSQYQITHASNYQVDLSSQPNGIYLYRIITQAGVLIGEGKIIIQR